MYQTDDGGVLQGDEPKVSHFFFSFNKQGYGLQGDRGSLHRIYLWCDIIIYLTQPLATWELQDKINIFRHTFRQSKLSLSVSMSSTKKAMVNKLSFDP